MKTMAEFIIDVRKIELHPMTPMEWEGYAGASSFRDGSRPLIAFRETDFVTVIVDGEGISLHSHKSEEEYTNCMEPDHWHMTLDMSDVDRILLGKALCLFLSEGMPIERAIEVFRMR